MQVRQGTGRSDLEHRAVVAGSAGIGRAIKIAVAALHQLGRGIGPLGTGEQVQIAQGAGGTDSEHGSIVGYPAGAGRPVEIAVRGLNERCEGKKRLASAAAKRPKIRQGLTERAAGTRGQSEKGDGGENAKSLHGLIPWFLSTPVPMKRVPLSKRLHDGRKQLKFRRCCTPNNRHQLA